MYKVFSRKCAWKPINEKHDDVCVVCALQLVVIHMMSDEDTDRQGEGSKSKKKRVYAPQKFLTGVVPQV